MSRHAKRSVVARPVAIAAGARTLRSGGHAWLSWTAFAFLAAIVVARLMMLETLRSPDTVSPGAAAAPAGPGPATTLVLDLLACVPALLVLLRRCIDRTFRLTLMWSMAPMALLGVWAVLSTLWAGDRFAALVSSLHLFASFVVLWTAAQVVRDWLALRLVAGICFGVLLVLVAHGANFVLVERAALREQWAHNRAEILRERNLQPGSFDAQQFERKVLGGEVMGFSVSPNTYAALIVLTMLVTLGAAIDRSVRRPGDDEIKRTDDDGGGGGAAIATDPLRLLLVGTCVVVLVIAPAAWMLYRSGSRTGCATAVLGVLMLGAVAMSGRWLARHARLAYVLVVACIALGAAALIGHGLKYGTLFHLSLTFRWRYWVGAARLMRQHPLLGVGWENFSQPYLAVRLPQAMEAVKDPHNFIARFFVELGAIGGVLMLAWMLRMWWEMTRPTHPAPLLKRVDDDSRTPPASGRNIALVAGTAVLAIVINSAASIDFSPAGIEGSQAGSYVTFEIIRRVVFLILLLAGLAAVCLRMRRLSVGAGFELQLDERPAPWVLSALLVALGLFLLHNLVDFSLFETAPLMLFALLCGAALGVRAPVAERANPAGTRRRDVVIAFAAGVLLWMTVLGAVLVPVASAEALALAGDEEVRSSQQSPGQPIWRAKLVQGASLLQSAFNRVPINGDYAYRAAIAWQLAGDAPRAKAMLDAAIAAEPLNAHRWLARADFELQQQQAQPDLSRARADYERAVSLDPGAMSMRIAYGELLDRMKLPAEAARQYERALWYNAQLPAIEPNRLPPERIDLLKRRLAELRATSTTTTSPTTRP